MADPTSTPDDGAPSDSTEEEQGGGTIPSGSSGGTIPSGSSGVGVGVGGASNFEPEEDPDPAEEGDPA